MSAISEWLELSDEVREGLRREHGIKRRLPTRVERGMLMSDGTHPDDIVFLLEKNSLKADNYGRGNEANKGAADRKDPPKPGRAGRPRKTPPVV